MKIPGFSAEASLHAMSGPIRLPANPVQPAYFPDFQVPCVCMVPDPTGFNTHGGRWLCCTRVRSTGLPVCYWGSFCHRWQKNYPGNVVNAR